MKKFVLAVLGSAVVGSGALALPTLAWNQPRCEVLPPGHYIAPGWIRMHHGGIVPIPCPGQVLPPGIARKVNAAPQPSLHFEQIAISNVFVDNIGQNSAHVHWTTNVPARSQAWYSQGGLFSANSQTPMVSSGELVTNHDMLISNLSQNTRYTYFVVSSDESGNTVASQEFSFMTAQ